MDGIQTMNFFQLNEALENGIGYKIYCDLDGVLCDLYGALTKRFDINYHLTQDEGEKLLKKIDDLTDFFGNLPWMPEGKQLWTYILPYEPTILTAASHETEPSIVSGKYHWCKENLGLPKNRIIMEIDKYKYAAPKHILVDDTPEKINKWVEAGGIGILHQSTPDTIDEIKNSFLTKRHGKVSRFK